MHATGVDPRLGKVERSLSRPQGFLDDDVTFVPDCIRIQNVLMSRCEDTGGHRTSRRGPDSPYKTRVHSSGRKPSPPCRPRGEGAREERPDHVEEKWTTSDDLLLPGEHVDHEHVGDDEDEESGSG